MRARIDGREGGGDVIRAELAGNVGQRPTWYVRDGERRADRERREREVGAGADERERDAMGCHPAQRQRRLEGGHAAARDDDLETREPGALPRTLTYAGSHGRLPSSRCARRLERKASQGLRPCGASPYPRLRGSRSPARVALRQREMPRRSTSASTAALLCSASRAAKTSVTTPDRERRRRSVSRLRWAPSSAR